MANFLRLIIAAGHLLMAFTPSLAADAVAVPLIPNLIGFDQGDDGRTSPSSDRIARMDLAFNIDRYVSWEFLPQIDVRWLATDHITYLSSRAVLRGNDALDYWNEAATRGVICRKAKEFHGPFVESKHVVDCAFTREDGHGGLEYCIMSKAGNFESDPQCQTVVKDRARKTILASRSVNMPTRGAGGEGLFVCEFPNQSLKEARTKIEKLFRILVGDKGIVEFKNLGSRLIISAKGTNLRQLHKSYYVRLNLIGEMATFDNGSNTYFTAGSTGAEKDYFSNLGRGVMYSYSRSFTVSARRSDVVSDYREPSEITEEEISSKYHAIVEPYLNANFPDGSCQLFQI